MGEKKLRKGTVQYVSRTVNSRSSLFYGAKEYVYFLRNNIAGNWLEELGSHIGDEVTVEYGEGCLCICLKQQEGVDLLPANIELSGLEATLVTAMSRESVLREYLKTVRDDYDVIILDCMPSLGMLTINALVAAESVIMPVQSQYLSVRGMEQLLRTISNVKRRLNPGLSIEGILITMADMQTNYVKEIAELLHDTYGGKLKIFNSIIPVSVRLSVRVTMIRNCPLSVAYGKDYNELLVRRVQKIREGKTIGRKQGMEM